MVMLLSVASIIDPNNNIARLPERRPCRYQTDQQCGLGLTTLLLLQAGV